MSGIDNGVIQGHLRLVIIRPYAGLTQTQLFCEQVISSLTKEPFYSSGSQQNKMPYLRALSKSRKSHFILTNLEIHDLRQAV